VILVDGKRTNRISALDRGLAYGDGVFRTMRAERGVVACWRRHYQKLCSDCGRLGIEAPAEPVFAHDIAILVENRPDCVVKLIVTRGEGGRGYAVPQPTVPVRVAASFPAPSGETSLFRCGAAVRWCITRLGTQPALAGVKHLNRLENVLARQEWSGSEFVEGLMLDQDGNVVGGTMSNLFLLERGGLVTPPIDRAGVAGVQRDRVLEIARRIAVPCDIEAVTPERVMAADQVYLTNSVRGLWWVSSLAVRRWRRNDLTAEFARLLRQADDD